MGRSSYLHGQGGDRTWRSWVKAQNSRWSQACGGIVPGLIYPEPLQSAQWKRFGLVVGFPEGMDGLNEGRWLVGVGWGWGMVFPES